MKKLVSLVLALALCLSLVACGGAGNEAANSSNASGNAQNTAGNSESTSDGGQTTESDLQYIKDKGTLIVGIPTSPLWTTGMRAASGSALTPIWPRHLVSTWAWR